jgi:hypothetical protein
VPKAAKKKKPAKAVAKKKPAKVKAKAIKAKPVKAEPIKAKPICRVPEFIPFGAARAKITFDFEGQMVITFVSGETEVWPLTEDQVEALHQLFAQVLAWHMEAGSEGA